MLADIQAKARFLQYRLLNENVYPVNFMDAFSLAGLIGTDKGPGAAPGPVSGVVRNAGDDGEFPAMLEVALQGPDPREVDGGPSLDGGTATPPDGMAPGLLTAVPGAAFMTFSSAPASGPSPDVTEEAAEGGGPSLVLSFARFTTEETAGSPPASVLVGIQPGARGKKDEGVFPAGDPAPDERPFANPGTGDLAVSRPAEESPGKAGGSPGPMATGQSVERAGSQGRGRSSGEKSDAPVSPPPLPLSESEKEPGGVRSFSSISSLRSYVPVEPGSGAVESRQAEGVVVAGSVVGTARETPGAGGKNLFSGGEGLGKGAYGTRPEAFFASSRKIGDDESGPDGGEMIRESREESDMPSDFGEDIRRVDLRSSSDIGAGSREDGGVVGEARMTGDASGVPPKGFDPRLPGGVRLDDAKGQEIVRDVGETVVRSASVGLKRAVLHVEPPELGRIRINLSMNGQNQVRVDLVADNPGVRDVILSNLDGLRGQLDHRGVPVSQIQVSGGDISGGSSLLDPGNSGKDHGAFHDGGEGRGFRQTPPNDGETAGGMYKNDASGSGINLVI